MSSLFTCLPPARLCPRGHLGPTAYRRGANAQWRIGHTAGPERALLAVALGDHAHPHTHVRIHLEHEQPRWFEAELSNVEHALAADDQGAVVWCVEVHFA